MIWPGPGFQRDTACGNTSSFKKRSFIYSGCTGRPGFSPWVGRSPRGGCGNPLQYACLENPQEQRSLAVAESDTAERSTAWHWILPGALRIFAARGHLSCSMHDLVAQPGIERRPPALGAQVLTHWTTRALPEETLLFS